ncbi:MAG: AraC family transcriptional regulator, partial [Paenibacillaceae bacterium]|nr:AraC family transcriptional regulator [Paenibacillaceae bacterium]
MTMIHAIQRAVDYIEAHLDDPFILDHAAEAAYMSIPNLYRGFYKLLGHTPKNYVRKRRVSNAAWHLRYTARSIEEISIMTGFMTESSFSKIFKKLTGLPPSAYRNADRHYIFDPIRIIDKVQLRDDKAWGSAYPNVNVKQLEPMHVIRHVYRADTEQGIECAAIRSVMGQLHWTDEGKRHLFGRNIEFRETPMYGYELMIPAAEGADDPLPGGLYAVSTVTSTNEKDIVQEWNRLQSEWLPQSGFTLGRHV